MIDLDPILADRVALGVVSADSVVVSRAAPDVAAEAERVAHAYRSRWTGTAPGDIRELQPARELYRRTGEDPTKLRPSSEALVRRVLRGDGLPRINSLVDTCNLCSLEFFLPIGLYDRDQIGGTVTVRFGTAAEGYESLGKGLYSVAGRLALFDDRGPFGSPTNDSKRTAVTDWTRRCLMVIFAPASYPAMRLADHVAHAAARLAQFAQAQGITTEMVSASGGR